MKILLLFTFFATDSLPQESQLFAALESFHQLKIESELAELNTKQKKKWLKYLPTVGVTYTLEGKPRPAISWSSTLLYFKSKRQSTNPSKKRIYLHKESTGSGERYITIERFTQKTSIS